MAYAHSGASAELAINAARQTPLQTFNVVQNEAKMIYKYLISLRSALLQTLTVLNPRTAHNELQEVQFASGQWVGLELDEARGKNNGSIKGVK